MGRDQQDAQTENFWLFTDGSVSPVDRLGFGAHLLVSSGTICTKHLADKVSVKQFENTSSSKLELEVLLWALGDIQTHVEQITVFTDSQTIVGLPRRRANLAESGYITTKGKHLKNALLYQDFFGMYDQLPLSLQKVRGHSPSGQQSEVEKIFALVDRAARRALRDFFRASDSSDA